MKLSKRSFASHRLWADGPRSWALRLLACACAACLLCAPRAKADNEEQIRARNALREAMEGTNAQSAATTPAPAPTQTKAAKPKKSSPPPSTTPAASSTQSSPTMQPSTRPVPPAQPSAKPVTTAPEAAAPTAAAPVAKTKPPKAAKSKNNATPDVIPPQRDSQSISQARASLRQAMGENEPAAVAHTSPAAVPTVAESAPQQAPRTSVPETSATPAASAPVVSQPVPSEPAPAPAAAVATTTTPAVAATTSTPPSDSSAPAPASTPQAANQTAPHPTTPPGEFESLTDTTPNRLDEPNAPKQSSGNVKPHAVQSAPESAPAKSQVKSKPAKQPAGQQTVAATPATDFKPIQSPGLPISGDKQTRLNDLLRKYQTDQITPEQYHTARAKILAEP